MATWKKLIYSGSRAELNDLTASAISPMRFPNITTNGSLRALVVDSNGNVFKSSADIGTSTLTLTDSYIYVGNGSNIATGVAVSGDATITNTGVLRLSGSAIGNQTLDTALTGTEEMLMLDGTTLKRTTINAVRSGSFTGSLTGSFTGTVTQPLASANIFVGSVGGIATAVALSGDATISSAGALTLSATAISGKTTDSSLGGAEEILLNSAGTLNKTTLNDLRTFNSTGSFTGSFTGSINQPLPSAQIFVGNAAGRAEAVAMSGDITIDNTGVTTIGSTKVQASMLNSDIISQFNNWVTLPVGGTSVFAISDGSNRKITYNQLTSSLSSSFSSAGLFGGDKVAGPSSAFDNAIARFDGTTGKLIQNSSASISDAGVISGSALVSSGAVSVGSSLDVTALANLAGDVNLGNASTDIITVVGTTTFTGTGVTTTLQGTGSINGDLTVGGKLNVTGNTTITGDLFVNGTTTSINTDNLNVEDKFILLNSGSATAADSGIIFQQTLAPNQGVAFGYDSSVDKFAVQKNFGATSGSFPTTPTAYVTIVENSTTSPSAAPQFGVSNDDKSGTIHIDTVTGDIWIYS